MNENNPDKALIPSLWWRDAIAKVIFLYVIFQFLRNWYAIYEAYASARNPLIPSHLPDYIAFPHYFLIVYWGAGIYVLYRLMKNILVLEKTFWIIPVALVAFLFGAFVLYLILMEVNPFG
ncbi:MAG: hypothetical protein CMC70_05905 [Flavobacteriaceae bacterium]|nr:hypothetical protein [Flavobacteriaceae bacterium]|tara:strand:+ start:1057 stop:1416 length:360 start_codon:yes stop_codon:yes gene_type:complete